MAGTNNDPAGGEKWEAGGNSMEFS